MIKTQKKVIAYIVGAALGDGNLSNPNGRAIRLRISCDTRYPRIIEEITRALRQIFPTNKVSYVRVPGVPRVLHISVYSNSLGILLPWKVGKGSKFEQKARVPAWIKEDRQYSIACLRGLLQTDGSIYLDRGYRMINFVNRTAELARDVFEMLTSIGFQPRLSIIMESSRPKYTVRLARRVNDLIERIGLFKA